MIGIVGGIGPLAGADLYNKIIANTVANGDQGHVPVLLASLPDIISDRTEYILGNVTINPGDAIAKVILMLEQAGAIKIGIACNTAHADKIFDSMLLYLNKNNSKVEVINMIHETINIIKSSFMKKCKIGVLCTSGSYKTNLFQNELINAGYEPVVLDFDRNHYLVHDSVYNTAYGIKSILKTSTKSVTKLNRAIVELKNKGSEGIILGCTEIAMVEEELDNNGLIVFNTSNILARKLIEEMYPEKLKQPQHYSQIL